MQYKEFQQKRYKKIFLWTILSIFLLTLSAIFAISSGNGKLDFSIIPHLFLDSQKSMILYSIRLPRTIAAILGGALLGISGCAMQGVLRNPLASPYTIGIAQASAFGASFAIIALGVLEQNSGILQSVGIVGCAFISSMVCMILILYMGTKLSTMDSSSLVLAGVALGALFSSTTMMLQFFASDLNAAAAIFWTFGDLGKATWNNLTILSICFFLSILFLWKNHWKMDALSFGDEGAKARGVDVKALRITILIFATLSSAVVVAYFGIIGFVGLVAPHITRLVIGTSYGLLIPFSAIFGSILLITADVISKFILPPIIMPIGIVTSFMGVPLFLYLLIRKKSDT
ncbi:iron siderophore ABC transporter, permease protein [Campylobacter blaseri]|uniref:ABC transporter permease n=1 Tax=Campylobacter blaseri TaxID=2042961 RepID=A0A2P8R0W7_9BACT|nr:iron ABC transporter permease [Campylobacter blaseri]PSM52142.1 ABC transporter permease [Campylobacter blaseri]PSM53908.1 ABC transporter permease [Campylobacter blaseri]QKF85342.1 iron siderophore ABC transporter, permease protein [Campylobacter blaseri]